jgi:hypothetical protein
MEIGILAWLAFGIVSAIVARNKGRSGCAWFFLGVLLGPFGLILAFASGSRRESAAPPPPVQASRARTTSPGVPAETWVCPRCGSANSKKLSRCGNCGYSEE